MNIVILTPQSNFRSLIPCEIYVKRQTIACQWLLSTNDKPNKLENFRQNMLNLIDATPPNTDYVAFFEDDDWYASDFIERSIKYLRRQDALATGCNQLYYWHVNNYWAVMPNIGASLASTVMKYEALKLLKIAAEKSKNHCIDGLFWQSLQSNQRQIHKERINIGIKDGKGLGVGHSRSSGFWHKDTAGKKLKEWIGEDAKFYL